MMVSTFTEGFSWADDNCQIRQACSCFRWPMCLFPIPNTLYVKQLSISILWRPCLGQSHGDGKITIPHTWLVRFYIVRIPAPFLS